MERLIVKVSAGYRIVIPKAARKKMQIRVGQKLVIYISGRPVPPPSNRPITELRGIAKGMKWRGEDRYRRDRF